MLENIKLEILGFGIWEERRVNAEEAVADLSDPRLMVEPSQQVALWGKVRERRALGGLCAVHMLPTPPGAARG